MRATTAASQEVARDTTAKEPRQRFGISPPPALAALERAVDAGLHDLFWFERCPLLEPLRAGPAYARMLRGMRDRLDAVNAALDAPL